MPWHGCRNTLAIVSGTHCNRLELLSVTFLLENRKKNSKRGKKRELQAEAARQAARQAQTLQTLPLKEQFAVLVAAYPRQTSGNWFAWRTFRRLARRGELPETSELLQMIEAKRQSEDWIRDAGRWIPGLSKWLNNRPWWKIDCREKKKTQTWRSKG